LRGDFSIQENSNAQTGAYDWGETHERRIWGLRRKPAENMRASVGVVLDPGNFRPEEPCPPKRDRKGKGSNG